MSRVLIIEDDTSVAGLLQVLMEQEGHTVTVASDGLEGLLLLRSDPPAVTILDIMMPDLDGVRVLEQLAEEEGGQVRSPIVVVTGSTEAAARCRQVLGADNVFIKPFDPAALVARVRALIGGEDA